MIIRQGSNGTNDSGVIHRCDRECLLAEIRKRGTVTLWCMTCGWVGTLVESPDPTPAELDPESGA